jgi:hypothetical protein
MPRPAARFRALAFWIAQPDAVSIPSIFSRAKSSGV